MSGEVVVVGRLSRRRGPSPSSAAYVVGGGEGEGGLDIGAVSEQQVLSFTRQHEPAQVVSLIVEHDTLVTERVALSHLRAIEQVISYRSSVNSRSHTSST